MDTTLAPIMFEKFKLESFSDEELRKAFKAIDTNNTERLEISEVKSLFENCAVRDGRHVDQMTNAVMQSLASADGSSTAAAAPRSISFDEFQRSVKRLASQRDGRIWPIAATMCVAGTSVGMVIPVMPLLVLQLGLTQAQYGYVVGCFGLSKLLANVPSSVLVSNPSIGRRGALTSGLLVVGGANVLISLASGFEELALARLLAGGGVSLLLAGATMAVADISTPLNRSSMMAPMNIAFSSGTVMGPAIGGMLSGTIGIAPTFLACGGAFAINAVGTRLLTAETMRPPPPAATATACDEGRGATGRADLHRAMRPARLPTRRPVTPARRLPQTQRRPARLPTQGLPSRRRPAWAALARRWRRRYAGGGPCGGTTSCAACSSLMAATGSALPAAT